MVRSLPPALAPKVDRTLRCLLRSTRPEDHISGAKGGMVNGRFIAALGDPRRSVMFTAAVRPLHRVCAAVAAAYGR